ncbi:hypothetical protein [Nannocystis pusilla]|uniref:hypothetical protein n=1 Tax=Nannocystis pusilla TaxID=889268 RepID=UPI003B7B2E14
MAALEAAAQASNDDALRVQALDIADRHQLGPEALRLAQALARDPGNGAAQLGSPALPLAPDRQRPPRPPTPRRSRPSAARIN